MKRYRVETETGAKLRVTSTIQHAIKHGALASELRITVQVVEVQRNEVVLVIPAIDKAHAIKPRCKRDRKYARKAKKEAKKHR
jgi:UPF0288 family protein (methanogenesis marker protein 3)